MALRNFKRAMCTDTAGVPLETILKPYVTYKSLTPILMGVVILGIDQIYVNSSIKEEIGALKEKVKTLQNALTNVAPDMQQLLTMAQKDP